MEKKSKPRPGRATANPLQNKLQKSKLLKRQQPLQVLLIAGVGSGGFPTGMQEEIFKSKLKQLQVPVQTVNGILGERPHGNRIIRKQKQRKRNQSSSSSSTALEFTHVITSCEKLSDCIKYLKKEKIKGWGGAVFVSGRLWWNNNPTKESIKKYPLLDTSFKRKSPPTTDGHLATSYALSVLVYSGSEEGTLDA